MNAVHLIGRLTKDVDLRAVNNNTVGRFTIAVERTYTNASGERDSDFISGVIWGKRAENLANFTGKGALVGIDGEINTGSYQNQQGQTVYTTDVNVSNFTLLETKEQAEQRRAKNGTQPQVPQVNQGEINNDAPWNQGLSEQEQADLPFE